MWKTGCFVQFIIIPFVSGFPNYTKQICSWTGTCEKVTLKGRNSEESGIRMDSGTAPLFSNTRSDFYGERMLATLVTCRDLAGSTL